MANEDQDALSKNDEVGAIVAKCPLGQVKIAIIPRKKNNIFKVDKWVKDLLAGTTSIAGDPPLRAFEYNLYPDLNTKRTLTVILTEKAWNPRTDVCPTTKDDTVKLELVEGDATDFGLSTTSAKTSGGLLEFQLEVKKLYKEKDLPSHQKIRIKATVKSDSAEILLTVHRNEDVERDFAKVIGGETILVGQTKEWVTSAGVLHLQELLNQVVARHKKAADFKWLTFDGQHDSSGRTDVKEFITRFRGNYDYEKGHFNVAVDAVLIDYIKAEYGDYQDGDLVDRKLLVGDQPWVAGQSQSLADGLLDIYRAVIERFFAEMECMALAYTTNFATFWLHRPSEVPYQQGSEIDSHYLVTSAELNVRNAADGPSVLEQVNKDETLAYAGEKQTVNNKDWFKVTTPSGTEGWCASWHLAKVRDDRAKSLENHGNYGDNAVAYSFGGKDRPTAFKQRLDDNKPGPGDIKSWQQYAEVYAPKKGRVGDDTGPGNGCDCSGFMSNCITQAKFPDGTRIVSEAIIKQIDPVPAQNWPWTNCIKAKDFVGDYSRKIPYHANEEEKQWMDQTDLITSPSHVVWIADSRPSTKHATNDREFSVYNEYGGDKWWDRVNGVWQKVQPVNKFIRKAIKMEFKRWGIKLNQANKKVGRIYFWS
jgi:hypothetical protein